ncbi:nuclear envelope integral membrane protein [Anastrepha ludens]|uniref:nuclear envelope integral membrane protein n=1 Tax=Anastrepha ludens TaxID=28586 RepID=UPI0023AF5963|nr:nuclear envelope integral membrane protein [Anastrepha ludens]
MKFRLLSIYLIVYYCNPAIANLSRDDAIRPQVTFVDPGTIVDYQPKSRHRGFFDNDMRIYCYRGSPKELIRFFENVELQLEIDSDDYTQYEGATPTEVRQHFEERRSLFSFNLFTQKRTRLNLSPFKQQCIGIDTVLPYRVRLLQFRFEYFRIIQFVLGVWLLVCAGRLSQNSLFFYLTGVVLGICSSLMLIIWLSSKLMPRRPMMYGILIGGWTLGVYIIQRLWENLHLIFQMYRAYVLWYIFITGLLSLFFCYRIGPPTNQRSKNIVKWVLQIIAITLIYLSSQYEEASAIVGITTAVVYYFPYYILHNLLKIYRRFFPPKRRLLTSEEFYDQGIIETTKALNELRVYASSPDCKQWKIVSKLSDPLRFASFVEGDSHLQEEEISNFESFMQANEFDDSDLSANGDEKFVEENQNTNLLYHHYENGQNQISKAKKNIAYEEMSEEECDSDDSIGNKEINAQKTSDGFSNTHIKKKMNRVGTGVRHFYSDDLRQTYNSRARKEQERLDGLQQAHLNTKASSSNSQHSTINNKKGIKLYGRGANHSYTYSDPFADGGSESDY